MSKNVVRELEIGVKGHSRSLRVVSFDRLIIIIIIIIMSQFLLCKIKNPQMRRLA